MIAPTAPKRSLEDLAVFGGPHTFDETLHVGRPNIGDRARLFGRLDEMLDRRMLTNGGPMVTEFEGAISALTGAKHSVAVTSATSGLEIVIRSLGLRGEVIVPSFTFVATAHALAWLGIRPVFCDVDPDTLTIDPDLVERLVTPTTSAILGVHLWGRACDTERLDAIGARHGIPVIYDAAHAFACSHLGRSVGTFGRAEVFSFHATKLVNSFEGGVISTDDDELARTARAVLNFGYAADDFTKIIGTNGKMHEASAAMGLTSLESLDAIVATNHENAATYARCLADVDGVEQLTKGPEPDSNDQYVAIRIDPTQAGLTRDELMQVLRAEGAIVRHYFYPGCHRMPPYAGDRASTPLAMPRTEALVDEALVLPTGTAVGAMEIERLGGLIGFALDNAVSIRSRLAAA